MRIILLGCPGAGKGTQAKFIAQKFHLCQISTGDILRHAIAQESALGKQVKSIVDSGQLVPDDIVIQLVKERIEAPDCNKGFMLDGFPRTVAQAQALEKLTPIDYVIDIDVPEEELVQRLGGRLIHQPSGRIYHIKTKPPKVDGKDDLTGDDLIQRSDDKEETVRKRLAIYQEQTSPLRDYYQHRRTEDRPLYVKIDGTGSVDEIKKTIFSILR